MIPSSRVNRSYPPLRLSVAGLTGEKLEFTDETGGKLVAVAVDGCLSGLMGDCI
jgi:hypothetical protein